MPRIRTWFRVSQDIFRDTQMNHLRDEFGDWIFIAWLDMLSWAERSNGILKGNCEQIADSLSHNSRTKRPSLSKKSLINALHLMEEFGWIVIQTDSVLIAKYTEYHNSWGTNKIPKGNLNEPLIEKNRIEKKSNLMMKGEIRPHASETQTPPSADKNHNKLTADELVELYNTNKPEEWAKCQRITPERRKKLNLLLREWKDIDDWLKIFDNLNCSQWLRGLTGNPPFHSRHRTIDWLFSNGRNGISNALKIYEGKYNDPLPPSPTLEELYSSETDNPLARDPPIWDTKNTFQEKTP